MMLIEGTGRAVSSRVAQPYAQRRKKAAPVRGSVIFAVLVDLAIACDAIGKIRTNGRWQETVGGGWSFTLFEGHGTIGVAQAMISLNGRICGLVTATTEQFHSKDERDACLQELQACCEAIAEVAEA